MSDQTVSDETIHLARMSVRVLGNDFVGEQWAERETELYVHMLAGVGKLVHYLQRQSIDENVVETIRKEVMSLLLESAEALRNAQQKLWADFLPDDEPSVEGGAP